MATLSAGVSYLAHIPYMGLGTPNGGPLLGASSGIYILQNRPLSGTYIRHTNHDLAFVFFKTDHYLALKFGKPTTIWHLYLANQPLSDTKTMFPLQIPDFRNENWS